jgi:hypothetical protein
MTTATNPASADHGDHDEHSTRRIIWTTAGVAAVAGAAGLLAGSSVPAVFAGLNLGNHNETLLVPLPRPDTNRQPAVDTRSISPAVEIHKSPQAGWGQSRGRRQTVWSR